MDEALLTLRLQNPTWYMALHSRLQLSVSNTFLGHTSEFAVEMPVAIHAERILKLPVQVLELGRLAVECHTLVIQDIMGLFLCEKQLSQSLELYVTPCGGEGEQTDITGFMALASECEESNHKGSDFAQVSDIREYLPGDKLRDIYWKLSARQEKLMVKERASLSGSEIALFLRLSEDVAQTQCILELAYSLGRCFLAQQLPVCFLCWNQTEFQFTQYRCGSAEELSAVYCDMFDIALSDRLGEGQEEHMRNCFPYLKSYLAIEVQDGMIKVEMREND